MKLRKQELRIVREKTDNDIITYVSTFNPKNPKLFNSIRENLSILQEDETMNKILQESLYLNTKYFVCFSFELVPKTCQDHIVQNVCTQL